MALIPTQVDFLELRLSDFSQANSKAELELTTKNEGTAEELQRVLKQAMENAKATALRKYSKICSGTRTTAS